MSFALPKEKDIQKQIVQYLKMRGAVAVRTNSGAFKVKDRFVRFNSEEGCSDLLCCYRGFFVALEVKRPGKKPTAKQSGFLGEVEKASGIAAVVTSIDDVREILDNLERA